MTIAFFVVSVLVGSVTIVGLLAIGSVFLWERYYYEPTNETQTYYFEARDGCRLAVHHYAASKNTDHPPVILVHGLSSNRYAFDLPHAPKLSVFLKNAGLDVWVAELRGSGKSGLPRRRCGEKCLSWGFDDHLSEDLPAIIDFVKQRRNASKVHIVGHSMGGMLILVYAGLNPSYDFASITTLGSSIFLDNVDSKVVRGLLKLRKLLEATPICPFSPVAKFLIPLAHWVPSLLMGFFEPANIEPQVLRRVLALGEERFSPTRLWKDFAEFRDRGAVGPEPVDKVLDGLSLSKAPIFLIGASKDRVVPSESVQRTFDAIVGGGKRRIEVLGKARGCHNEYGHMDLRVGRHAEEEVFPLVLEWMCSPNGVPDRT
jgi:pimeloyl-ACP methyl ester carboxylesterase